MKKYLKYFSYPVRAFGFLLILSSVIGIFVSRQIPSHSNTDGINANQDALEQNVTITNYIPTSPGEWRKYNRLKTGDYPYENVIPNKLFPALCELKLLNDSRLDAVVFLVNAENDSTVRHVYLRQGSRFTFYKIKSGKYYIKTYIGFDWDENKYSLKNQFKGGFKYSEALVSFNDSEDDFIVMEQNREGKYAYGSRYDYRIFHKSIMNKIESKGNGIE